MEQWEINGVTLEYIDETHTYIADGVIVPSITQMLQVKFGNKYNGVSRATLENAAAKGTEVHRAIEQFCKYGEDSELKEVRNFKFLQKRYGFEVSGNEIPVILFDKWGLEPIAAGRLDLTLAVGAGLDYIHGIGDIKRTATLDKNYLAYQLNLYRIAYMQCYGVYISFLKGIHLRDDTRKYIDIPINEGIAWELVELYFKEVNNDKE
jgi:hypothetical protein